MSWGLERLNCVTRSAEVPWRIHQRTQRTRIRARPRSWARWRWCAEREDHYLERLRALDGKSEYNVKASHDEQSVLRRVLADDPELRAMAEAGQSDGESSYEGSCSSASGSRPPCGCARPRTPIC
ncbi:GvpL/GvpF family gas vesicle protein [Streptomyces sp. NPDC000880]